MAAAPDEDDNELNFSDIDSDDDDEPNQPVKPMIAHKDMTSFINMNITPIAHKDMKSYVTEQESNNAPDNQDFEPISPPNEQVSPLSEDSDNELSSEKQNFEPISPVSDTEDKFEAISPPGSPAETVNKFENISDDEEDAKKEEEEEFIQEGKFSPIQESDNELNFDDESSNDSGYQIIKTVVKMQDENTEKIISDNNESVDKNEAENQDSHPLLTNTDDKQSSAIDSPSIENSSPIEKNSTSVENTEEADDDDIEAPLPSPFSDIGDLEDMPGAEGAIISDILKDTSTTEQFEVPVKQSVYNEITHVDETIVETETAPSTEPGIVTNQDEDVTSNEPIEQAEKQITDADTTAGVGKENLQAATQSTSQDSVVFDADDDENADGQDAGDLIADIFGESDEEEEFEGFADEDLLPEKTKAQESGDEAERDDTRTTTAEDEESSDEEDRIPVRDFVSDFELMLQKRKEMNRMKRRAKKEDFHIIGDNDDIIAAMINQMKEAAEEDRMLNQCGKAATKKLKMLESVTRHLRKSDLQSTFIENGVLPAIKDWLSPLPDHALPHVNIRKTFLRILNEFPPFDKETLKGSGIGRAVMLLFKHPKETRENKKLAGKIISNWARPIFNVSANFNDMSREEREDRDKATLPEAKRRRLSSGAESSNHRLDDDNEAKPRKPGDKGWIGRARVPMPSHRDYVNRPVSKIEAYDIARNTKKEANRYEKHARKMKEKKTMGVNKKAVGISLNGSKMNL